MEFNYRYAGNTAIESGAGATDMSFAPDTLREPTFFSGELRKHLEFREAISALHDVVVSDLRYKPRDKSAYLEWAKQREQIDWQQVAAQRSQYTAEIKQTQDELTDLNRRSSTRMQPFYRARQRYFDYLYKKDRDAWFVLDPVITVHPDELFFECFSQDESSYGRLGCNYEVFKNIGEFACGTTNIDYSAALYDEFQKIRRYKTTQFAVDPGGFDVQTTGEESYRELKIDLPDTWVRGFLQVSSAMTLPAASFDLHPMDVHNLCFVLRRNKERKGPRSMRFQLKPDHPVKIVMEPWNYVVECPRSIYKGDAAQEIRVWGRRRIHILERLIPVTRKFTVHLLGRGMPSFYVADLGDMNFTLGLSGWTSNDWSTAGNFDLMAPRAKVDDVTKRRVFEGLKDRWYDTADGLASRLNIDRRLVLGALSAYTQAGRVMFDLDRKVFRVRELSREPLPMSKLRFANKREETATRFVDQNKVKIQRADTRSDGVVNLRARVQDRHRQYFPELTIDRDERMVRAVCTCNFYSQNKLHKGPCEHILAARMQHAKTRR